MTWTRPADEVVYAASLAIGFASFENLGYLPLMSGAAYFGRALVFSSHSFHFSSIWGYLVVRARIRGRSRSPGCSAWPFLAASIHGLFNILTVSNSLRIYSAFLILCLWLMFIYLLEKVMIQLSGSLRTTTSHPSVLSRLVSLSLGATGRLDPNP